MFISFLSYRRDHILYQLILRNCKTEIKTEAFKVNTISLSTDNGVICLLFPDHLMAGSLLFVMT